MPHPQPEAHFVNKLSRLNSERSLFLPANSEQLYLGQNSLI
jgi:hypothetical protein